MIVTHGTSTRMRGSICKWLGYLKLKNWSGHCIHTALSVYLCSIIFLYLSQHINQKEPLCATVEFELQASKVWYGNAENRVWHQISNFYRNVIFEVSCFSKSTSKHLNVNQRCKKCQKVLPAPITIIYFCYKSLKL